MNINVYSNKYPIHRTPPDSTEMLHSKHSVFDEAPGSMTRYTIQLAY